MINREFFENRFGRIAVITRKELKSYTGSPVLYILMTAFLLLSGILYFWNFYLRGQADLRAFFSLLPFLFMFLIPLITMRQFADELNSGSFEMLVTLPVSMTEIFIGKFLSCLGVIKIMLAPTLVYVAALALSGSPDFGPVIGGYVGAVFLAAAYISIGLFASALTKSQIVAALVSASLCIFFSIIDIIVQYLPGKIFTVLAFIGTAFHFQSVSRGIIDFRDLAYFATFTVFFALLTLTVLEEKRGGKNG